MAHFTPESNFREAKRPLACRAWSRGVRARSRAAIATTITAMVLPGTAAQLLAQGTQATVSGLVVDSAAGGEPLLGALVQLARATAVRDAWVARTDHDGRFVIADVPAGEYRITFFHPALELYGITIAERSVTVPSPEATWLTLAVPPAATVLPLLCAARPAADSASALVGWVRDADSGDPPRVPVDVEVAWWEVTPHVAGAARSEAPVHARTATVRTRPGGAYLVCGLPGARLVGAVHVRARAGARTSGAIPVPVAGATVARRDLRLGAPAEAHAASVDAGRSRRLTLRGIVTQRGRPVAGASVVVAGSAARATSDAAGRFVLGDVPAGTQVVEARSLGLTPGRVVADVGAGGAADTPLTLALGDSVRLLPTVAVSAERERLGAEVRAYLERQRRLGAGQVFLPDARRVLQARTVAELLLGAPGVTLAAGRAAGQREGLVVRGDCVPALVVDGRRVQPASLDDVVERTQVVGIEVFKGAAVPPEYVGSGQRCAIAVWTVHARPGSR